MYFLGQSVCACAFLPKYAFCFPKRRPTDLTKLRKFPMYLFNILIEKNFPLLTLTLRKKQVRTVVSSLLNHIPRKTQKLCTSTSPLPIFIWLNRRTVLFIQIEVRHNFRWLEPKWQVCYQYLRTMHSAYKDQNLGKQCFTVLLIEKNNDSEIGLKWN